MCLVERSRSVGRQVDNRDRTAGRTKHQNRRKHTRQRARWKRDYFTFDSSKSFFFWERGSVYGKKIYLTTQTAKYIGKMEIISRKCLIHCT